MLLLICRTLLAGAFFPGCDDQSLGRLPGARPCPGPGCTDASAPEPGSCRAALDACAAAAAATRTAMMTAWTSCQEKHASVCGSGTSDECTRQENDCNETLDALFRKSLSDDAACQARAKATCQTNGGLPAACMNALDRCAQQAALAREQNETQLRDCSTQASAICKSLPVTCTEAQRACGQGADDRNAKLAQQEEACRLGTQGVCPPR